MKEQAVGQVQRGARLWIEEDSDAVFAAAIRAGVLSEDPEDGNFAGHYMYMHHDGEGVAYFKHRETRAYVTMRPAAGNTARKLAGKSAGNGIPGRIGGPGPGLWATVVLAGAFLGGALVDYDLGGPGIGTVRLEALTAEFFAEAVRGADTPEATAQAARTWGRQLEAALEEVAGRHGVVLFGVEAVVAGADDYTGEVRAAMRRSVPTAAASGGFTPVPSTLGGPGNGQAEPVR